MRRRDNEISCKKVYKDKEVTEIKEEVKRNPWIHLLRRMITLPSGGVLGPVVSISTEAEHLLFFNGLTWCQDTLRTPKKAYLYEGRHLCWQLFVPLFHYRTDLIVNQNNDVSDDLECIKTESESVDLIQLNLNSFS